MEFQLLTDISWVVNLRTPMLTPIFEFFTWLGYRNFLFMFIPFTYWIFDSELLKILPFELDSSFQGCFNGI